MKTKVLARTTNLSKYDWLAYRRQGIGGSDTAAILGLNPYSSAFSVYMDKLGLAADIEDSESMWIGREMEAAIAKRFQEETGFKVQRRNAILQHPEYPFLLANIDRLIPQQNAGLEIKTTSPLNKSDFQNGDIPASYYCQCMHYLAVTGLDMWYLAVAVLGRGFHVFKVERNETEINALIEAERGFWENHVLKQTPPDPDGSAGAGNLIKARFPQSHGDGVMIPLFGMESKVSRILELDDEIKSLEKEQDKLKQAIELEIGDADGGVTQTHNIFWRTQFRNSLDSKKFQAELPDVYQKYSRTTAYRKFEIKERREVKISA